MTGPQASAASPTRRRGVARAAMWMSAGAAMVLVAALGIAALALPWLDDDPRWAARWLGDLLGREVELATLEVTFADGAPVLRLRDVRVGGASGATPGGLELEEIEVEVAALASLSEGALRPRRVSIVGASVALTVDPGGVSLEGFGQQERPASEALGVAIAALPRDSEFTLERARVKLHYQDLAGRPMQANLAPARLRLAHDGEGLALSGEARLDETALASMQVRWHADADPLRDAELVARVEGLGLARLSDALGHPEAGIVGDADVDLSARLVGGHLEAARGGLELRGLGAHGSTRPVSMSALFDLDPPPAGSKDAWKLELLNLLLTAQDDREARPGSARLRVSEDLSGPLEIELDALGLPSMQLLADSLAPELGTELEAGVAAVRTEDLRLSLTPGRAPTLSLRFEALSLVAAALPVGLTPAAGHLSLDGQGGRVDLSPLTLTLPPRHDGGRHAVRVSGAVDFAFDEGGVSLRPRDFLVHGETGVATLSGTARWHHDRARLGADLRASIPSISSQEIVTVLGSGLVDPPLDEWLRGAIGTGEARGVEVGLLGSAGTLSELSDILRIRGTVHELELRYAPGWPALSDVEGELWLRWPELGFRLDDGRISGNRIDTAEGWIDDVDASAPRLGIRGRVNARTERGAAFLLATPLRARFEDLLTNLDARGRARISLNLDIPVDGGDTTVSGTLDLTDNTVAVPSLSSALEQVGGQIRFTGAGLRSGKLEASYLGRAITATLAGGEPEAGYTDLAIGGRTTPAGLMRHLHDIGAVDSTRAADLPLLSRLKGEASWAVRLKIPAHDNPDRSLPLTVESDLAGMALDLPAPLGKTRSSSRTLRISTRLSASARRRFQVNYGKAGRAVLEVRTVTGGYALERAGIRFGGGAARLPEPKGISVDGELSLVSVDSWLGLIAQLGAGLGAPGAALGALQSLQLQVGVLDALGIRFRNVDLRAQRARDHGLQVDLQAPALSGRIDIPLPLGDAPVSSVFTRLHAPAPGDALGQRSNTVDARRFPPLDARVEDLRVGDLQLGSARLSLRRGDGGIRIERVEVSHPAYGIAGSGTWRGIGSRQSTSLALRLQGADLGQTLRALGYSDNGLKGAPVDVNLDGQWPGSPLAFSFEALRGTVELDAGRGRFTGASPGATGRVFGLLSLTMLPRRLFRLDFSDLFGKGIGFRRISGRFSVEDGNAYTNTLSLDADTAQVNITGRAGLVDRDYDQTMTVVPKLSSSLPLVPLWLAEQVLDRKLLDPAFAYRYSVSGSWDDPVVERIRSTVEENGAGGETSGSER